MVGAALVRKTFCDRCGAECVNTTGHFGGHVEHTTSKGETVGIDEIEPMHLCNACIDVAQALLGFRIRPQEMEKPLQNMFEGGMHGRDFDSITVHGGHYMGPADAGTGDDHERAG